MAKKLFLILGNGFTIDFIKRLGKENEIDPRNLFRNGDKVPWVADNEPGFLSYKRCPYLWNLGARTNNSFDYGIALIEDIITCAHLYRNRKKTTSIPSDDPNVYIKAYIELALYLRYLFSYYNSLIKDSDFQKSEIKEWGWTQMLQKLNSSPEYEKIVIVCYNYDIFLERLLQSLKIKFTVAGFSSRNNKFELVKPHGSISFRHKKHVDNSLFNISYNQILSDGKLKDLKIDYDNTDKHTIVNPMIPPAGDSSRFDFDWSKKLRNIATEKAQQLNAADDCIICGMSYWHVDRNELDELLLSMDSEINVKMVNPSPNATLNAVISSIFKNYINYSSSEQIHKII